MAVFTLANVLGVSITDYQNDDSLTTSGQVVVCWQELGSDYSCPFTYANMKNRKELLADAFAFASRRIKESEF